MFMPILENDQILVSPILLIFVDVVDFNAFQKAMTQSFFSH